MEMTHTEALDRMIGGNPVLVSLASTDYVLATDGLNYKDVKAISAAGGTVVYVEIVTDQGATVTAVPIPAPGSMKVRNVTKVLKAGTDGTGIVLWMR